MKHNFCPSCGSKLEQEYKFCPSCGNGLSSAVSEKSETKLKQGKNTAKSNSYLILLISFVFAVAVVFFVLDSNSKSDEENLAGIGNQNSGGQPTEQMNQMMQSILDTKKALEEDPGNYDLNIKMGNNSFDIGRFEQAIKYYRTAIKVNDKDPNVLIDLGVAYFNINAADSALFFMNSALTINPIHPQGLYNAGIVHFSIGDSSKAVEYWEKLVSTNGDLPQAKSAQKFIEQLKSKISKS